MAEKQTIQFHYIKANLFRVIHVDGAIGGLTPTGDIFVSLYSQRGPIPQITVQEVGETGELGGELMEQRKGREGLVREVEVGLAIRPQIAEQLVKWLQEKIDLAREAQQESKKAQRESKSEVAE
jgi:hypothetical protein